MAENTVEIVVKSRDSTKAGFTSAAAGAEAAGGAVEGIWSKHADNIGKKMDRVGDDVSKGLVASMSAGLASAGTSITDTLASILPKALSAPPVAAAIGIGIALLAPFIGQAVGGGIIVGLGAALTGMAIAGAMKNAGVQRAFADLKTSANNDLADIGKPFVPVMESIFKTASSTLGKLTPVFKSASAVIAGPFQVFSDALIRAFGSPAVTKAIGEVAASFGKILTAMTPQLAGDIDTFANAIGAIANNISKHPQAFTDFIWFLVHTASGVLSAIDGLISFAAWLETNLPRAFNKVLDYWASFQHQTSVIFDGVRHETAQIWDGIYQDTIGTVIRFGHNVETQFNSARHEISVIFDGVRHDTANVWDAIWNNTIGRIRSGFSTAESSFSNGRHSIGSIGDGIKSDLSRVWDAIWDNTVGRVRSGVSSVESQFNGARRDVSSIMGTIERDISSAWASIWNNTIGRISRGVSDATSWFRTLPGKARSALGSLGSELESIGKQALQDLLKGMKAGAGGIGSWLEGFAKGVVSIFKKIWGWFSPSRVMYEGGKSLMEGLAGGVKDHAHKAMAQVSGVAHRVANVGSGVSRWKGLVDQALRMNGVPQDFDANVLYQMMTESGGNPNAINLTDSNAAAGDPSRGLMQVIMSTFRAYHVRGTSNNIYDPLANIAAAINYAKHVYGPNLANQYGGIGSGHGYAGGGPASGWAWVGERGRELVRLPAGSNVVPHGNSEIMAAGGGGMHITLELGSSFKRAGLTQQQLEDIRYTVTRKGGGSVQAAFGRA